MMTPKFLARANKRVKLPSTERRKAMVEVGRDQEFILGTLASRWEVSSRLLYIQIGHRV